MVCEAVCYIVAWLCQTVVSFQRTSASESSNETKNCWGESVELDERINGRQHHKIAA